MLFNKYFAGSILFLMVLFYMLGPIFEIGMLFIVNVFGFIFVYFIRQSYDYMKNEFDNFVNFNKPQKFIIRHKKKDKKVT